MNHSVQRSIFVFLFPALARFGLLTECFLVDTKTIRHHSSHELYSVSKTRTAVLDGSSFNALDLFLAAEGKSTGNPFRSNTRNNNSPASSGHHGYCSIVTATLNNKRVIGIIANKDGIIAKKDSRSSEALLNTVSIDDNVHVYKDSLASIPKSISDEDAISTCIASLAIHCAIHDPVRPTDKIVENVGGSSESFVSSVEDTNEMAKKVVVVGGGDYASFIAE